MGPRVNDLATTENCANEAGGQAAWEKKLLPLMASLLILLAIFASVSNFYQARVTQQYIKALEEVDVTAAWQPTMIDNTSTFADRLAWAQWRTLALLESQIIRSRYHQARVTMMNRVYMVFLGFATGVVMALVGAAFILGKLHESVSSVKADVGAWRLAFRSSSPGLVLAFLGTVLILATIWAKSEIEVRDNSVYLPARQIEISPNAASAAAAQRAAEDIRKQARAELEKPQGNK